MSNNPQPTQGANLPAKAETVNLPVIIGEKTFIFPDGASKVLLVRAQHGWKPQEIATLGSSDVFVRRDTTGQLRLIKQAVRLYADKKEIASVKGNWIPTIAGYNKLNQVAALQQLTPPTLNVNGNTVSNPYVEYVNGEAKRVYARKIALGYSPIGTMVAVDVIRHYNFDAYYLQDLQAKLDKHPDAARFGTSLDCPWGDAGEALTDAKSGTIYARGTKDNSVFVFKVIKDIEGIWIDPSHGSIIEVYNQHIRHQVHGETTAQSMAWRNALKAHPAIATSQVTVVNGVAEVVVYGWKSEMSLSEIAEVAEAITRGEAPKNVEVNRTTEEATYEEVKEATEEAADETVVTGSPEAPRTEPPTPIPPAPVEPMGTGSGLSAKIAALAKEKNIDLDVFCNNVFKKKPEEITGEQQERLAKILESTTTGRKGAK